MHTAADRDELLCLSWVCVRRAGESVVVDAEHVLEEFEAEVEASDNRADAEFGGSSNRFGTSGGHVDRWIRSLNSFGYQASWWDLVVLAHEREDIVVQCAANHFEPFNLLRLVFRRRNLKGAQCECGIASADTEFHAAVGQNVFGGQPLGDPKRVVDACGQQGDQVHEPNACG